MDTSYKLRVNGQEHVVRVAADTPLLYVLRNDLSLNSPKFGCGLAQCGACAVLKDGREIRSCVTPVATVVGSDITTSEGLGMPDRLHPLQAAFVDKQAAQCGYCTSGMVIAAVDLLRLKPTEDGVKRHMDTHLCRCGSHMRVIEAIAATARAEVPI